MKHLIVTDIIYNDTVPADDSFYIVSDAIKEIHFLRGQEIMDKRRDNDGDLIIPSETYMRITTKHGFLHYFRSCNIAVTFD